MLITQKQKDFFELFGYLYLPGTFTDEIADIARHFDALFDDYPSDIINWTHEFHDNRPRRFIPAVTEKSSFFAELIKDQRIQGVARALLGQGCRLTGSDASIYDCGTKYHQDGHHVTDNSRNIKLALYLDPIDATTGAVRVIPGSHHSGDRFSGMLNRDLFVGGDKLGLSVEEVPATVLANTPGDLMLWDYRVLHATSYGGNQRRMFAMEFSNSAPE